MRFTQRAVTVITMMIAGLVPAATAAASAPSAGRAALAASAALKVKATIPVDTFPAGIAANPKTNTVYVANVELGTIDVISGHTNTVTGTIPTRPQTIGIAVNPKTDTVYAVEGPGGLYVASGRTDTVTTLVKIARPRDQQPV